MANYAYIRVSTDMQTCENQKIEIKKYCKLHKITKVSFVEETVSGTKDPSKRKLKSLLDELQEGDTLVVTEISRLGRSINMIFGIIDLLLKKKIRVIAIKQNFILEDNIQSQVLVFAFGLSAQIERDLISERTKMGLERARKNGKQIGRRKGQKPSKYKLTGKENYIRRKLKENYSILYLSKDLQVSWTTLKTFAKENKLIPRNYKSISKNNLNFSDGKKSTYVV